MSDFNFTPDSVIEETVNHNVITSRFENGSTQRRLKGTNSPRSWGLNFVVRTKTEMETVRDFFNTKNGSLTSFTWTNPNDSIEYTVIFSDSSFTFIRSSYNNYSFNLKVEEEF